MTIEKSVKECFVTALKEEQKGKKHKGLLATKPDVKKAEEFVAKARKDLSLCQFYKEKGFDYKIPEEWFYTLYYCALAILAKFGVESRSQRCTALFLRYIKDKGLIEYEDELIEKIIVHREKSKKSAVDEREKARYSSLIKMEEVERQYDEMMALCKKAISQAEEIVFSDEEFKIPEELLK